MRTAPDDDVHEQKVLILPSDWTSVTKGSLPVVPPGTWLATEWWLERCIKNKTLIDPELDVLSQPHLGLPIDGTSQTHLYTVPFANDIRLHRIIDSNHWHGL